MSYNPRNPNGQATKANSSPVTLASDQELALPTGAATGAKQDTGNASLGNLDTKTPALGQALAAASTPVVLTAAQLTALTPISGNLEATQLLVKAKTDNLDVALSTVAKSSEMSTQTAAINTLLKPANTLAAVTTVTSLTQMNGAAISMNTGVRDAGTQRVTIATNDSVPVSGPITDAQIRATALPVSGTVSANATLSAETTKIIGTVNIAATQNIQVSNSPTVFLASGNNNIGDVDVVSMPVVTTNPSDYKAIIDEASAAVTYVGRAVAGSATSAASWQISKYTLTGVVLAQTTADSDFLFNNVWDNRASLTYG